MLDAIEVGLAARYQAVFDDTDFYDLNPDNPISITITIGDLPTTFIADGMYGLHTRGWDATNKQLIDEPDENLNLEYVISTQLKVDRTLEPQWQLYTERDTEKERSLQFQHRQMLAPTRLGPYIERHLSWGRQSILTRLTQDKDQSKDILADAARIARQHFTQSGQKLFNDLVSKVQEYAGRVGVRLHPDISARLDVKGVSVNTGGISLHHGELPLRVLGAGSARLMVAALQHQAGLSAPFAIIDEVEHGLEPHRIARLLKYLKDTPTQQVFLTTHSPVVLEELAVADVLVVRRASDGRVTVHRASGGSKDVDPQRIIRTDPNAYLAPAILVCEGKTEVGIARGLDQHWTSAGKQPFATAGVVPTSGGGIDEAPKVARYFRDLAYNVALFLDSDVNPSDNEVLAELSQLGVKVMRWAEGEATEDVLFQDLRPNELRQLLEAIKEEVPGLLDQLRQHAGKIVHDWNDLLEGCGEPELRKQLAVTAKKCEWIKKRLTLSERIGREILGPHSADLKSKNQTAIRELRVWIDAT